MAAEDMISEGAPLWQPSRAESEAALARALPRDWSRHLPGMMSLTTAFWAGFAAGLALFLLGRKLRPSVED